MIRICSPVSPDLHEVQRYFDKSLSCGRVCNGGPSYDLLASRLAEYLGVDSSKKDVVLTSSGHTALMSCYNVIADASIIVPDYTFRSTLVAASGDIHVDVGDVDVSNAALSMDAIDGTSSSTVVVVCPLSTIPDLSAYQRKCDELGKRLIIDGAATFGTKGIVNWGNAFCISMHGTKSFPVGEGGIVVCDKEYTQKIKQYLDFGIDRSGKGKHSKGVNGKISELSCAVGLALLDEIDQHIDARLANAEYYRKRLGHLMLDDHRGTDTVYQMLPIFSNAYPKSYEVQLHKYYEPLTRHSRSVKNNADKLFESNICLPVHQDMTMEDLSRVVDTILRDNPRRTV